MYDIIFDREVCSLTASRVISAKLPTITAPDGTRFPAEKTEYYGVISTYSGSEYNFGYGLTSYICYTYSPDGKKVYYSSSKTGYMLTIPEAGNYELFVAGENEYTAKNGKVIPGFTLELLKKPKGCIGWQDNGNGVITAIISETSFPEEAAVQPPELSPVQAEKSEAEEITEYIYGSKDSSEEEYQRGNVVYKTASGVKVSEIHLPTSKKAKRKIELAAVTDLHLNILHPVLDRDDAEVQYTDKTRYWCRGGATKNVAKKAFDFASKYDCMIVTGDILDYLTIGSLEYLKKIGFDKYPEAIYTIGGHDVTKNMESGFPDALPLEERCAILQKYWNTDINYTSKLVGECVLCIGMNNGISRYCEKQVELLEKDLAKAREMGYTVLIFQHEPIATGNPSDAAVPSMDKDASPDKTTYNFYGPAHIGGTERNESEASAKVYSLITNNADIINGIFCGHRHYRYYTEILAHTKDGKHRIIPQYVMRANAYEHDGFVTKIIVDL